MRSPALIAAALALAVLPACSSDAPADSTEVSAPVAVTSSATLGATEPSSGRIPGQPIQVDMFVRVLGEMYASNDQPAPTRAEALEFAASMCGFLDVGNSPYDAAEVLNDEGYPEEYTSEIVAKAIGAACTEHFAG